jgi:hypothetical protein
MYLFLMSRVGAMVSPYISLVLIQVPHTGLILCLSLYGAAAAGAALCSLLLPKVFDEIVVSCSDLGNKRQRNVRRSGKKC